MTSVITRYLMLSPTGKQSRAAQILADELPLTTVEQVRKVYDSLSLTGEAHRRRNMSIRNQPPVSIRSGYSEKPK